MKKIALAIVILAGFSFASKAQTQKDWFLIGSDISDIGLNIQKGNTAFSFAVSPKVAWFIKDNFALGGQVNLGINTKKGSTDFNYGIGPLARYYFGSKDVSTPKKTRLFGEANVGIFGQNTKVTGSSSYNTNGLGFGIGPGVAYFINENIALEGLVKYNGTVGFGNSTTVNAVNFNLGLQIYLPKTKLKSMAKEMK
ncbi:MAG: outer membrane beta-barrel protein [Ferruginibacter sp.]